MANFNSAWNEMGTDAASVQTRRAIEYLLRGPEHVSLEDRRNSSTARFQLR